MAGDSYLVFFVRSAISVIKSLHISLFNTDISYWSPVFHLSTAIGFIGEKLPIGIFKQV
jgi:hypothetical protein